MLITTTHTLQGKNVEYLGISTGETIMGANFIRDYFASLTDFFGGRSRTYEMKLRQAKESALHELRENARIMGGDAVIGVDLDYETIGRGGTMLMVVATGTAVKIL